MSAHRYERLQRSLPTWLPLTLSTEVNAALDQVLNCYGVRRSSACRNAQLLLEIYAHNRRGLLARHITTWEINVSIQFTSSVMAASSISCNYCKRSGDAVIGSGGIVVNKGKLNFSRLATIGGHLDQ